MKKIMITLALVSAIASIDMIHASAPAAAAAGAGAGASKESQEKTSEKALRSDFHITAKRVAQNAQQKLCDHCIDTFKAINPKKIAIYFTDECIAFAAADESGNKPDKDKLHEREILFVKQLHLCIDESNWAPPICDWAYVVSACNAVLKKLYTEKNLPTDDELLEAISIPLNPELKRILENELEAKEKKEKLKSGDASAAYPT